ncbi:MAG: DUF456 domain-containing protein [Verrucomicrobiota bacterium]
MNWGDLIEPAMLLLTAGLTLVGLIGVIVPVLPGTTLIFMAMLVHKLVLPDSLSWAALGWIGVFWVLSIIIDFVGVLIGTRLFGGSKWGLAGASGGALVGMFFSLPALILGTVFGAVVAERYVAKRTGKEALLSGAGAAVGFVLSTAGRLACAAAMIAIFTLALWMAWSTAGAW